MSLAQNMADEALVALAKAKVARQNAETIEDVFGDHASARETVRDSKTHAHELFIEANVLAIAAQIEALGE